MGEGLSLIIICEINRKEKKMRFDIDELEVGNELLRVVGELEYDIEIGDVGDYWNPPIADEFHVTHVDVETCETENGKSVTINDIDQWVVGWFEGDEGIEILQQDANEKKEDALVERALNNLDNFLYNNK